MALSGSFDFSLTANELITHALKKANLIGLGQSVPAVEAEDARVELNLMLKHWQVHYPHLWKKTEVSVTMVNATASYDLSSENVIRVLDARYRDTNDIDLPMTSMVRGDYFDLPQKDSAGIPTTYYFDPQRGAPTLYVWPVKATVTTETLRLTTQKRFNDIDSLSDDIDIEPEWLDTVRHCLTARLLDSNGVGGEVANRIITRSESMLREAADHDREDCVVFYPSEY